MRHMRGRYFFDNIKIFISSATAIKALLLSLWSAIAKPRTAFKRLPKQLPVPRKLLIAWLGLGGLIFVVLHFGIAQKRLLLQYPSTDLVHILFMPLFSIWIWLAGSVLFYLLVTVGHKKVKYEQIEVAVLRLWVVWFSMPLIDLPHLLFDLPFVTILGVGAHISWIFAFIWLPLLSYFLLKDVIGFKGWKLRSFGLILSLAIPFIGRFGIENLPLYIEKLSRRLGTQINYDAAAFIVGPSLFAFILVIREVLLRRQRLPVIARAIIPKTMLIATVAGLVTINAGLLLEKSVIPRWLGRNNAKHVAQTETTDRGKGSSRYTNSHTWTSPDYEPATFTRAQNNNFEGVLKEYLGVVDLDFDPSQATINAVRCRVNFTSATADYNTGDATPRAHCDIQPNGGAYQQGAYQGPLNGTSGTVTWSWASPAWGSSLAQSDNSVRVFGQTAWNGNTNTPLRDVIAFDSVTIEIDYEADLTQTNYRWYNNNDSVQPGSARAAESTVTTAVEENEVMRLRTGLQVATGIMDVSTEAFKLQFASKIGGSCGDDESWSDVGGIGSGVAWRGFNNPSPANGAQISASLLGTQNYARQTYQEDNTAFNNTAEINQATNRGEWDWTLQAFAATPNTTYCFRMIESGGASLDTYSVYPEAATATALTINHAAYRWFDDSDTLNAGNSIASQDSAAYSSFDGAPVRLRVLLDAEGQSMPTTRSFKLQYSLRSGFCDTGFSGESYVDVETSSGDIRFYDNLNLVDGATTLPNTDDPQYLSHLRVYQTYNEANTFDVANTVSGGQSGLWDLALIDHSAPKGATYCFRIVEDDGTPLGTYTSIPELTTVGTFGADIVDEAGDPVPNPIVGMSLAATQNSCQTTTGTLGTALQKIRAENSQPNSGWTLSVAATIGPTALWSSGGLLYDFNDPSGSPAGCAPGLDSDTYAGQLSIDPSSATITPEAGCSSTGISKGSAAAFHEGVTDSIIIATGAPSTELFCYFDFADIGLQQTIPGAQPSGTYNLDLTITMIAS